MYRASVVFCLVSGDQHDVALDGVTLRCAVAAVGGVGLTHGNVAAVQRDLALKHHAFVLRGQVACNNGVIGGSRSGRLLGKCADAHGDGKGQHQGCGNGLTASMVFRIFIKIYLLYYGRKTARSVMNTERAARLLQGGG